MKTYSQLAECSFDLLVDEEQDLITKAQAGDLEARERLILSYMKLIRWTASRYQGFGVTTDELVGDAIIGFYKAIEQYQPPKSFQSYATYKMRFAIQSSETMQKSIRIPFTFKCKIFKVTKAQEQLRCENKPPDCVQTLSTLTGFKVQDIKWILFVRDNLFNLKSLDETLSENFTLLDTVAA